MSLPGSATPLRIDLLPSRYYYWMILVSHLLSAALLMLLSWHQPLVLLTLPLLLFSLFYYRRDYFGKSAWRRLRCHRDGRVECFTADGRQETYLLQHAPIIFPWMLILPLGRGRRHYYLALFSDAMQRRQWLDLRRFLRYSLD